MKPNRTKLTPVQKSDLYTGHIALAHKIGGDFARRFRRPHTEMVEEAQGFLALCIAQWSNPDNQGYNPTGCSPTTWIYRTLYWNMLTLCTRKRQGCWHRIDDRKVFVPCTNLSSYSTEDGPVELPARESWYEALLRNLGEDARVLLATIVDAPRELAHDVSATRPAAARKALQAYLTRKGWSADKIETTWLEVEACL